MLKAGSHRHIGSRNKLDTNITRRKVKTNVPKCFVETVMLKKKKAKQNLRNATRKWV